jgi:histone H3/H4
MCFNALNRKYSYLLRPRIIFIEYLFVNLTKLMAHRFQKSVVNLLQSAVESYITVVMWSNWTVEFKYSVSKNKRTILCCDVMLIFPILAKK